MKQIAVIGTGYVGLVTGTCFAELGNDVTCVDIDEQKVRQMQAGQVPIYEPGLEELFVRNLTAGRLQITLDLAVAVSQAEIIFLALPTPMAADGSADLSYVLNMADQLGPLLQQPVVIVNKSTVPVGTAAQVRQRIAAGTQVPFDVVSNPEFLREGLAVQDFMEPDRIIVGAETSRARKVMADLYEPLTHADHPLLFMSERSAEMTKYAANSFLAVKINFINQIANLCERLDADVEAVRQGIGSDQRIGMRFLYPGIGYGGSCFPKDVQALVRTAEESNFDFQLLKATISDNQSQRLLLIDKVRRYFKGELQGRCFALWGLAFKPETDDIREAPSIDMLTALIDAGAEVRAFDPAAMENVRKLMGNTKSLKLVDDPYAALEGADGLLIATDWPQFKSMSLSQAKQLLRQPIIFDGRNLFEPADMARAGFYYECIGRPIVHPAA